MIHLMLLATLLGAQGGHTSGYTRVTRQGPFHSISLETPSIEFARDPETGESGEQRFHAQANTSFEALLDKHGPRIAAAVDTLKKEFPAISERNPAAPVLSVYQLQGGVSPPKGPCRMTFPISYPDSGALELSFKKPPERKTHDAIAERVKALFTE